MSIFGWSYPPGCSGPPDQDEHPCEVCGLFGDYCICPPCKECESVGDPRCYKDHGMVKTPEQIKSLADKEKEWADSNAAEHAYWAKVAEEEKADAERIRDAIKPDKYHWSDEIQ